MCGVVYLCQRLKIEMRIDLGGGDAGVAEELLHCAQVLRGLQHVGGEGMPQHVRMHVLAEPAPPRPGPQPRIDGLRRDATAAAADEERPLSRRGELRPARDPDLE